VGERRWRYREKKKNSDRERVITGLPVFSKPLFYLTLPVAVKRRSKGKKEEEEEVELKSKL